MKEIPHTVLVPFAFKDQWFAPPSTIELTKPQALYLKQQGRVTMVKLKEEPPRVATANRGK